MDITYKTDQEILEVRPNGKLQEHDLQQLGEALQRAAREPSFNGLLIESKEFPGYEDLSDMLAHAELIKQQKDRVARVAIVTDSAVLRLLEALGNTLGEAEVKHFEFGQHAEAERWLVN